MNGRTWVLGSVIAAAGGLGLATQAQATLIGDMVNFELTDNPSFSVSPNSALVGAGVEAQIIKNDSSTDFDIDVDDASITLTALHDNSFDGSEALRISDMDWVGSPGRIVDFGLNINGVFGLFDSDIAFGDDFVIIVLGGTSWDPGDSAVINLEVDHDPLSNNAVPEPITATLGVMGIGALAGASRRRT